MTLVHIDDFTIELESPADVALFVACLGPTPEKVEAANQDTLSQRAHITRELGFGFDADGRPVGEAATA